MNIILLSFIEDFLDIFGFCSLINCMSVLFPFPSGRFFIVTLVSTVILF